MALTKQDLERAVEDERRLGSVGYNLAFDHGQRLQAKGRAIVLREANRQGWSYDDLVLWVDSKYGRWFWDSLYGCSDPDGAAQAVTLAWVAPGEGDYVYQPTSVEAHVTRVEAYRR